MNEEIALQNVKFPNNFTFTKMPDGFKVNCTGGEFFPNKNATTIGLTTFATVMISILSMAYFLSNADKNEAYKYIGIGCFLFGCLSIITCVVIMNLTNIKAEYTISSKGINVTSEKGNVFIPKENIKKKDIREELHTSSSRRGHSSSYYYYVLYIELFQPINLPYTNENKDVIALFSDYTFREEKTARFLLKELDKMIDSSELEINEINNLLEEAEEDKKVISINEIEIPKDLNYQRTADGFTVKSTNSSLFPNNVFFMVIGMAISYILLFISFPIVIPMLQSYAKNHFSEFISIIIVVVYCFGTFIGIFVAFAIYGKMTTIIGDFKISPNGININCKKGTMSISQDNIANVYIEKEEVQTASNGRYILTPNYKIFLDFKEPQYIQFTNSKVEKAHLFGKVADKKVARFFVQEMKKILQMD